MNLVKSFKQQLKFALARPCFARWVSGYRGNAVCLTYHRIIDKADYEAARDDAMRGMLTEVTQFEKQMQYLSEHYQCLDLSTAITGLKQGTLPPNAVIITFDDGYKDNLTRALPCLKKYGIPATIFIATGFIDHENILWWYEIYFIVQRTKYISLTYQQHHYHWSTQTQAERERAVIELNAMLKMMNSLEQCEAMNQLRLATKDHFDYTPEFLNWEEIQALDNEPLITLAAHTRHHLCLRALNSATLVAELIEGKQRLEEKLGHAIAHFAYPFGGESDADNREFLAAQQAGFTCALTTRLGYWHNTAMNDLYALPRIDTNYSDTIADFMWKISGWAAITAKRKA